MCTYIYTNIYVYMYISIYICRYIYIYMYIYIFIYIYVCVYVYIYIHTCSFIRVFTRMYLFIHVDMYVCNYTHHQFYAQHTHAHGHTIFGSRSSFPVCWRTTYAGNLTSQLNSTFGKNFRNTLTLYEYLLDFLPATAWLGYKLLMNQILWRRALSQILWWTCWNIYAGGRYICTCAWSKFHRHDFMMSILLHTRMWALICP